MSTQFDPGETITGVEVDGQPTQAPPAPAPKPLGPGGGSPLARPDLGQPDPNVEMARKGFEKYTAKSEQDYEEGERKLAPQREKLLGVLNSPVKAQAHLKEVQEQPKPEDYRKGAMEFAASMAVVGAIFGRGSRNAGNAALNAFAGAMKGWKEGNLEAYTQATKEWEESTKKTIENNQIELEKYRMIIEDKKLNIDQMSAAFNIASTETGNKVIFDQSMAKNYTTFLSTYDKMVQSNIRLQQTLQRSQELNDKSQGPLREQALDLVKHPEHLSQYSVAQQAAIRNAGKAIGVDIPDQPEKFREIGQPRSAEASAFRDFRTGFLAQNGRPPNDKEELQWKAKWTATVREASTIAMRAGNIEVSAGEAADTALPLALTASNNLPRGRFVPITEISLKADRYMSVPEYRRFVAANEAAITAYGATMSRNGVNTVHAQERAASVLNVADSPEAYAAGIDQLQQEVAGVRTAPQEALKRIFGVDIGESGTAGGAVPKAGGGKPPPTKVSSPADAQKLAPGTHYVTPDGQEFTR